MLLRPSLRVDELHQVDPALLVARGIRAVMVDLDDTLVATGSDRVATRHRKWLASLQEAGLEVLILSNGNRDRVTQWSRTLGIDGLALVGKPFGFAFRRGLRQLGRRASETAMIGDQLFTDVLGANLTGIMSILVTPLSPGGLPHTRALRQLERMILGGPRGSSIHR
ncbi:MAG TPA: YqeG family HAD IIIA-type phosphatase [Trueperaceae bacterium]